MQKAVTILLLFIHLFNTGGYRLVFDHLEKDASRQLVSKLDNEEYADDQLVEMKVPLNIPYQTSSREFERFNGEIEINGIHYNYVKRRIWNDTLTVMVIPNHGKMSLNNAKDQFFSLVNDLNQQDQAPTAPKSQVIKTITTDYQATEAIQVPGHTEPVFTVHVIRNTDARDLSDPDTPSQPPRA